MPKEIIVWEIKNRRHMLTRTPSLPPLCVSIYLSLSLYTHSNVTIAPFCNSRKIATLFSSSLPFSFPLSPLFPSPLPFSSFPPYPLLLTAFRVTFGVTFATSQQLLSSSRNPRVLSCQRESSITANDFLAISETDDGEDGVTG